MALGLGLGLRLGSRRGAGGQAAWHPDDSFTTWDAYFIAEAADVGSPGDGNAVAAWVNRGAADCKWIQGTAGNRPLWREADAGLNGRPAVDFDGTDDFLNGTSIDEGTFMNWDVIGSASALTLVIVLLPDASDTDDAAAANNDKVIGDGNGFILVALRGSGATKQIQARNFDGSSDQNDHTITYAQPLIFMARHAAGQWTTSVNGGAETSIASGDTSDVAAQVRLGGLSGATPTLNGRVAFVASTGDGNPTDLATMITNLKAYYGIA